MRIVCISDTHNTHESIAVPDGDVLVHAGDATILGTLEETNEFAIWFANLPHRYKIFVAGNHDWLFETDPAAARKLMRAVNYLQDSAVEFESVKFYGSPWQPRFFDWAFNLSRGAEMAEKWRLIPRDTDVLITHCPPFGILDETPGRQRAGCEELRETVERIRPRLHVFGHIHHSYGKLNEFGVEFANASNCDEDYAPANAPLVFDL